MKLSEAIKSEKGFALILSLVVMAAMTAIGIAAIMTSTTDMLIARNDREAKTAFFLSEAGVEEAIARIDLSTGHARYVGETFTERQTRIAGTTTTFAAQSFTSASLNPGLGGSYTVGLAYAFEAGETWCRGECNDEIVIYCDDFGFQGQNVPTSCAGSVPVYRMDSDAATTAGGTETEVRAYVAATTINVVPPLGEIFSNTGVDAGGSIDLAANVCSDPTQTGTTGCTSNCTDVCPAGNYPGDAVMEEYLGIDLSDLKSYADPPSPYNQVAQNVVYDAADWGTTVCSASTTMDPAPHVCGNDSKIIYIDNPGMNARITSNGSGRGVLIVTGDLEVAGTLLWEGMIYVMGSLGGGGTVNIYGTIMANSTIGFSGNVKGVGSKAVAGGVAQTIGIPKVLRWARE